MSGGSPPSPSSTEHSISEPSIAASTITFGSHCRAFSMAASSCVMSEALDVPMLDPPRAGLTNSGQPSSVIASSTRLRSGSGATAALSATCGGQSRSPTTTCGPTGSPRAWKMSFMYSLSMLTALASTPAPT